jgi:hypothetical protein
MVLPLTKESSELYSMLEHHRRFIEVDGERLVVYPGNLNGHATIVTDLVRRGLVCLRQVGRRRVVVLGVWDVSEKRYAEESQVMRSDVFTPEMVLYLGRYSEATQLLIERVFRLFATTRKCGVVSPNVLLQQLVSYDGYPIDAVHEGLGIYLRGDYAERGIGEPYALGIVRGAAREKANTQTVPVTEDPSRGPLTKRSSRERERVLQRDHQLDQLSRERFGCGFDLLVATRPVDASVLDKEVGKNL